MAFSATDAAFEGFRLTRAHPKAVALWAAVSLVFNLVMIVALVTLSGPALSEMMRLTEAGPSDDPSVVFPLLGEVMRGYAVMLPLLLIFMSVIANAVYRASSRPEQSAFGYLRLGAAELRLLVVSLVVGLLGFVAMIIVVFALSIVGGLLSVAFGGPQSVSGMLAMTAVIYLGMFFAYLAFYVKFSFAGPMTFLKGRIDIFGSWKATAGKFWPLMGCYVIATMLGAVVGILGWAIGLAAMMAFGGDIGAVMMPDMSSLAAYLTPGMIAYVAIAAIFNALVYVIFFAPAMVAYQSIHGTGPADVSKAFD